MFCKGCGKSIDTSAATCPHCGRSIDILSGGTGFWDLLEKESDWSVSQGRFVRDSSDPAAHVQTDFGDTALAEQSAVYNEIPMMINESDLAGSQMNSAGQRAGSRSRKRSFVIRVSIVIGVLIVVVAICLSQCLHTNENHIAFDEDQSATSVVNERLDSDSQHNDEDKSNQIYQNHADGKDDNVNEDGEDADNQSDPYSRNQDVNDSNGSVGDQSEEAQGPQYQSSKQQQEEGTRNGQ